MATAGQVAQDVEGIGQIAEAILTEVSAVDPAVGASVAAVTLVADLATKAIAAWGNAAGQPVTAESIAALMPNATPLSEPTA